MNNLLSQLKGVRRSGDGWIACCPSHQDGEASLSLARRDGKWLLKCFAGCSFEAILHALGLEPSDLFDDQERGGSSASGTTTQPCNPAAGLTIAQYAVAKALPEEFLKSVGLSDMSYLGRPAVRMPYLGPDGGTAAARFRIALDGDRFRWKTGSRPHLYGLNRLGEARDAGNLVLVEGESDCHTLWYHHIPALGLPGASSWREDRDAPHLDGIDTIYVVVEPDRGGQAVKGWLSRSAIRYRVKLVELPTKDPSALHLQDPGGFKRAWTVALLGAVPWTAVEAETQIAERSEAWERCSELARSGDILETFEVALERVGVVGEVRLAKLLYLAVTSRLLDRPVSVAVKGPSSAGKSFTVESVLKFFPPEAFYSLTAMSEHALAYSTEPLRHRHLVIYEAAGMAGDLATYLIRSLLSEGRLRYETVEKTGNGLVPKLIEREGPTGLIVTTTSLRLHPENETRMLSLTVTDTSEQTAAVFRALARETGKDFDVVPWHSLQTWLSTSFSAVTIPFAEQLAELVPAVAVRLRRDFKTVLLLIRAHAMLHQATRQKDSAGRIIAEIADYATVRNLVADLIAEGVEAIIKPETREVVNAVAEVLASGREEVMQSDLRKALRLDKSAVSRRIAAALDAGVLRNKEDRKGRPARLVLGDPLPEDLEILPRPERLHGCAVGAEVDDPHPSPLVRSPATVSHTPAYQPEVHVRDRLQSVEEVCAGCGKAPFDGDPLLPFGTESAGHSWLHFGCWSEWHARRRANESEANSRGSTEPGLDT